MKLLINISLFLAVVLHQLCAAASGDITSDKLYPLINLIAAKANIYATIELLEYGHIHSDLWSDYNKAIAASEKSNDYQDFSERMEQLLGILNKLEKDKGNCNLQKDTHESFHKLYKTESATKWREFEKVQKREQEMKKKDKQNVITTLNEIYAQLPAAIESFKQALDEKEKEQYNAFIEHCEQFLAAKDAPEKFYYFSSIMASFDNKKILKSDQCKLKPLANFMQKLVIYLV